MNKEEIKAKLTELNIAFDATATKAELQALLPEGSEDSELDGEIADLEAEIEAANEKAAEEAKLPEKTKEEKIADYIKIIAAYKKQNPRKYGVKKAAFEKKLAALRAE